MGCLHRINGTKPEPNDFPPNVTWSFHTTRSRIFQESFTFFSAKPLLDFPRILFTAQQPCLVLPFIENHTEFFFFSSLKPDGIIELQVWDAIKTGGEKIRPWKILSRSRVARVIKIRKRSSFCHVPDRSFAIRLRSGQHLNLMYFRNDPVDFYEESISLKQLWPKVDLD